MKHISSFFDRLLKEDARIHESKKVIQNVCSLYIKTIIPDTEISLDRGVLFLKIHNSLKVELLIHKEKLLAQLKEQGVSVKDIR